jgi:hypothetical protein
MCGPGILFLFARSICAKLTERGVETTEIDIERLELGAPVVVESGLNAATHGESRARRVRRKSREGSKPRSTERRLDLPRQ